MDNEEKESQKEPTAQEELDEDEINLIDYFRVIFKYRKMILWICGIAIVTMAIISLLSPKTYSATASIIPPIGVLQREPAIRVLGADKSTLIDFLESRVVADAIINRFDLMKVYDVEKRSVARKTLQVNTIVKASEGNIVHITVEDRDPNRAAAVANAYVEELDRQNKRLSAGQATGKRVFLESRLAEIEGKLSNIENIPTREARIQEMLFELLTREYEIAKIEEAKSMPTIQVLDRAVVPEVRMPRRTKRKVMLAGVVSFMSAVFLAFFLESLRKSDIKRILKEG